MNQSLHTAPGYCLPPHIEPARLTWQDGMPVSEQFGDIYFARSDGLEESRHVFLQQNRLAERFARVGPGGHFVVAETGFGTGLNFLATWQAWQRMKQNPTATLHFVSVEKFPLSRRDLGQALSFWPELAPLAKQLLDAYPPLVQGCHRILLEGGHVRLTLYFGDILEALSSLAFTADAWFLDGFTPSLNPQMWLDETLAGVRNHSKAGTTIATFTSVGRIRRGLSSTGFLMQKATGYGSKRHLLAGHLPEQCAVPPSTIRGPVAIAGAGIAGCLLARNLADRGIRVVLIDSGSRAGTAASGNRQGAMYVKPGVEFNDQTRLALASLLFSQRFYARHGGPYWHRTGLLQLAWSPREQERQKQLTSRNHYPAEVFYPVDRETASQLTGTPVPAGGLWFPGNGWLEPAKLCRSLSDHPLITTVFDFRAKEIRPAGHNWTLSGEAQPDIQASHIVICAGHQSPELIPGTGSYRFKSIRGQVTHLEKEHLHTPVAVICGQRYVNPAASGIAVTGATFDLRDSNPGTTPASHHENIMELQTMLPGMLSSPDELIASVETIEGRTAFRCTTHDYQPVAGELYDAQGNEVPGIYLLTGFGSKGLTYAPLLAEYVADILTGQPACLPARLARRVRTQRMHRPGME
jgi:tRNA 5-methylaminomethyl-2-thiouridine biosynthesis bifunctional protein